MRRALVLVLAGMLATPAAAQTSRERVVPVAGVKPDVLVNRTAHDIARDRDAELEVALSLLGRGR